MKIPHQVHPGLEALTLECDEGGFTAVCPQIQGAVSEGETEEEALENLVEAIEGVMALNAQMAEACFASKPTGQLNRVKKYSLEVA